MLLTPLNTPSLTMVHCTAPCRYLTITRFQPIPLQHYAGACTLQLTSLPSPADDDDPVYRFLLAGLAVTKCDWVWGGQICTRSFEFRD